MKRLKRRPCQVRERDSLFMNSSPQHPQRQPLGLQHLSAFTHDLYSFDLPFTVFPQDYYSIILTPLPAPSPTPHSQAPSFFLPLSLPLFLFLAYFLPFFLPFFFFAVVLLGFISVKNSWVCIFNWTFYLGVISNSHLLVRNHIE